MKQSTFHETATAAMVSTTVIKEQHNMSGVNQPAQPEPQNHTGFFSQ